MRRRQDNDDEKMAVGAEAPTADTPTEPAGEEHLDEAEILRRELELAHASKVRLEEELKEAEGRYLRAVAELDTMRRRMLGEVDLARLNGLKGALTPALGVYDDLERALTAAEQASDPSSIVPGVRAVRDALLRNLSALEVELTGRPGEKFDPNLHEALTMVPLTGGAEPGTIHEVYQAGFVRGDELVRAARVTVFADEQNA